MPAPLPPTITADYQRDWPRYFEAVASLGPRDTLVRALDLFGPVAPGREPVAIDVACGEGRDTREMLRRGWRVVAFDGTALGVERLLAGVAESDRPRLTALELRMEDAPACGRLPASVDLINASFALPFCDPAAFPALWAWIVRTLAPGGRFAGQIFGERDEWAPVRPASHYSREQVLALLEPFDHEHFEEVEKDGGDALGTPKHHHLFHIVARKR